MIAYPIEAHTYRYEGTKDQIVETLCDLETLRHELGDELYNTILANRSKVIAVINHRKFLRENARFKNMPTKGKNLLVFRKINQKLPERIKDYKNQVNRRIRECFHNVLKVENYRNEEITRDDSHPYYVEAECTIRSGWRSNYTNYKANLPFNWMNTPAAKVMAAFDNKFFAIECRHEPEYSTSDMQMYWVNRAVRTAKVGFKEAEVGYAAINDNEFVGWGSTPGLALKALNKDIAKAAKARLLATFKA
jgi:hypothetical protein